MSNSDEMSAAKPLRTLRYGPLNGRLGVPGDKSISHRALLFGALATGKTTITGLLEAEDVINTAKAVSAMGAATKRIETGDGAADWVVYGRGTGGLIEPDALLDFGNSGTGTRLMMGVLAGHDMTVTLVGDASLSSRPMARVLDPLRSMGIETRNAGSGAGTQDGTDDGDAAADQLPLTLVGTCDLVPIVYDLPVASAQVKSAVLLAGLHAAGETTVVERHATRDHTERMLEHFGADLRVETQADGTTKRITIKGHSELTGRSIAVPGDPSSAAFLAAAALIVPGSQVTVTDVLVNPTRTGFYLTVQEMGGDVVFLNQRMEGGEPIADIRIRYKPNSLSGIIVPPERAPSMIDEYPILAVVAAFADGATRMEGLAELKVKESDRLAATADGLNSNGITAQIEGDALIVTGAASAKGGGTVKTHMDHRIAMAFAILGLASDAPVTIDDARMIDTSFPEFQDLLTSLGAKFG